RTTRWTGCSRSTRKPASRSPHDRFFAGVGADATSIRSDDRASVTILFRASDRRHGRAGVSESVRDLHDLSGVRSGFALQSPAELGLAAAEIGRHFQAHPVGDCAASGYLVDSVAV